MAMFHPSRSSGSLALAIAICFLLPGCFSDQQNCPGNLLRACHCFDDHNVYNECNEEFRLSAEGAFHVEKESVDEYCGGPCFAETKLALQCVEDIADESFKFSNGASVPEVKEALSSGCSETPERGTFEIRERRECGDEYYQTHHRHEQGQAGYGEESEQQYQGGGDWGDYCYGGAGRTGLRSLLPMLLLFLFVSATLLPVS